MTKTVFPRSWTIRSSTSRFFPVHSTIELTPKGPKSAGFELAVTWEEEKHAKLKLFEEGFVPVPDKPGTWQGTFFYPKASKQPEGFRLVASWFPETIFADGTQRLLGLLVQIPGHLGDEGTGVWVAEAKPRE